ncbi:MAG: hypothetical protein CSA53_02830 [Gammaproteobacteria bacterium]|nr:MAG: hypothetical protein CSA53_02830 [Gammaproteobacteria bacterium]
MTELVLEGIETELSKVAKSLDEFCRDRENYSAFLDASHGLKKVSNLFRFLEFKVSYQVIDSIRGALSQIEQGGDVEGRDDDLSLIINLLEQFSATVMSDESSPDRAAFLQDFTQALCRQQAGTQEKDDESSAEPEGVSDGSITSGYVYQAFKDEVAKELDAITQYHLEWRCNPNNSYAAQSLKQSVKAIENAAEVVEMIPLADYARWIDDFFPNGQAVAESAYPWIDLYVETLPELAHALINKEELPNDRIRNIENYLKGEAEQAPELVDLYITDSESEDHQWVDVHLHLLDEDAPSDSIKPAVFDVFKEEIEGELERVKANYTAWKNDTKSSRVLSDLRLGFHSIKGTSNVAGVAQLSEFAGAGESLLNRVTEGLVYENHQLFMLFDEIISTLHIAIERLFEDSALPEDEMKAIEHRANIFPKGVHSEPVSTDDAGAQVADGVRFAAEERVICKMDPGLKDVFVSEATVNIQMIESFVKSYDGRCAAPDSLLRALHSLHGSAYVAGADTIAHMSGAVSKLMLQINACGSEVDDTDVDLLSWLASLLRRLLALINVNTREIVESEQFLADVEARAKSLRDHLGDWTPRPSSNAQEAEQVADIEAFLQDTVEVRKRVQSAFDAWWEDRENIAIRRSLSQDLGELQVQSGRARFMELMALVGEIKTLITAANASEDATVDLIEEARDMLESVLDRMHLKRMVSVETEKFNALSVKIAELLSKDEPLLSDVSVAQTAASSDAPLAANEAASPRAAATQNFGVLELFLEEADEHLERLDSACDKWLSEPQSRKALDMQLRQLHTLKGNARLTNLTAVADLSHVLESLYEKMIAGDLEITQANQDLARDAIDRLQFYVDALQKREEPEPLDDIIEAVNLASQGGDWHGQELRTAVQGEQVKKGEPEITASAAHFTKPTLQSEIDTSGDKRIRVSAVLLDTLVRMAGDINIAHRDMEAKNSKERYNLSELELTIARLKRQLALLDFETDSKIIARVRDNHGAKDKQFDPLEMDHYSTLQHISRAIGETVNDLAAIGGMMSSSLDERESLVVSGAMRTREMHDRLLVVRQQPVRQLYARLERVVRMAGRETGKAVRFDMVGQDVRIDSHVLNKVLVPIEHLLRNAVAHGIETPEKRGSQKDAEGLVELSVEQDNGAIVIVVSDDGAGLDRDKILEHAVAKGMIDAGAAVSEQDIYRLILTPGLTTVDEVSKLSGRGIGMDAVVDGVRELGGTLSIASTPGKGSSFTVRLPASRSITKALLVKAANHVYAIPHGAVSTIVKIPADTLKKAYASEHPVLQYGAEKRELHHLGSLLGLSQLSDFSGTDDAAVLFFENDQQTLAMHVDELVGTSEIQVQPVVEQLKHLPWFIDSTILANGDIALVLDLNTLLENASRIADAHLLPVEPAKKQARPLIMVVDDSLTVRKITSHTLENNGFDVVLAKDGVDAIAVLQDVIPEVMLLDVEMPRMNGFELAAQMSNTPEFKDIPIIMITSRTGDKHRKQALDLGVHHYLGKPFNEPELIGHIHNLIEGQQHG